METWLPHLGFVQRRQVGVAQVDGAGVDAPLIAEEAHDRERRDRLARAALPYQPQHLAPVDDEIHVLDNPQGAVQGLEDDAQAGDLEQRFADVHRSRILGSMMSRSPSPNRLNPMMVTQSAALPDNAR